MNRRRSSPAAAALARSSMPRGASLVAARLPRPDSRHRQTRVAARSKPSSAMSDAPCGALYVDVKRFVEKQRVTITVPMRDGASKTLHRDAAEPIQKSFQRLLKSLARERRLNHDGDARARRDAGGWERDARRRVVRGKRSDYR